MRRLLCAICILCLLLAACSGTGGPDASRGGDKTETSGRSQNQHKTEGVLPNLDIIPHRELRYFLEQLDEESFANACAIYEAALNFEGECTLPYPMDEARIHNMIVILRYECPELFQLDFTQSFSMGLLDDQVVRLELPLVMDAAEYARRLEACRDVIDTLTEQTRDLSDEEKELYVYRYIAENCSYTTRTENCGSAYGCLVEGAAKCDGISFAMKWVMEELGIRCLIIGGEPRSGSVGHAWNLIEINGKFYDLDVTADVSQEEEVPLITYPAYNVNKTLIRQYYILDEAFDSLEDIPGSKTMTHSYHAQNNCYVEAGQEPDLEALFLEAYGQEGSFSLQFEDPDDYEAFMDGLDDAVAQIAEDNAIPGYRWQSRTTAQYFVVTLTVGEY